MKRKIKLTSGLLILVVLFLLTFLLGEVYRRNVYASYAELEEVKKAQALESFTNSLKDNNFEGIYETTSKYYPNMNRKEDYEEVLSNVLKDKKEITIKQDSSNKLRLYGDDVYLADVEEKEDGYVIPINGTNSYVIEVPTQLNISTITGTPIETDVLASNFEQLSDKSIGPQVDYYEVNEIIGLPKVDEGYDVLEDPITGHLLLGKAIDDEEINQFLIDAGERLAAYPAQDGTLGQVSAISLTSSSWYQRYTGVQNYWFTSHKTSNFSNQQVLKVISQKDDTYVGHVVFDYFADNGEVSRTWHCGYQITIVKKDDGYKIAALAINNELNPNTQDPELTY